MSPAFPESDEPANGPTEDILQWLHKTQISSAGYCVTRELQNEGSKASQIDKQAVPIGHSIADTLRVDQGSQGCEDENIHAPGAIQSFGLLVALEYGKEAGVLPVRIVSDNSGEIIGKSPQQLFALNNFTDLLSGDQVDVFVDHIDLIKNENDNLDHKANEAEVFLLDINVAPDCSKRLWCAMHKSQANADLIICEFEIKDDPRYPLAPSSGSSQDNTSDYGGVARISPGDAEKCNRRARRGKEPTMEVLNVMTRAQERLTAAPSLEVLFDMLVDIAKELTGFHRVMIYQFDTLFNGQVVAELGRPPAGQAHFHGLRFPASDISKQARELYKKNRVQVLYDREDQTAKLVCRDPEDLETPLDLTHSYLRAMSPVHLLYLKNMAVRSSMSISISAGVDLWGLIICHSYDPQATRISFPSRSLCRFIGEEASRNIERLHVQSRLQAWSAINRKTTELEAERSEALPSKILLDLFKATSGLFWIGKRTKLFGHLELPQEALAISEYLKVHKRTSVTASVDILRDFPELRYSPGFENIVGVLVVPLSEHGGDFVVFFRAAREQEIWWAGNPHKEDAPGICKPRSSFEPWSETVTQTCDPWSKEDIEVAKMLCLVSEQLFQVWNGTDCPKTSVRTSQRDSQLTQLLLANTSHELRTPLNAVINYLEVAENDTLDPEAQEILAKSSVACQSFIRAIGELFVPDKA